MGKYVVSARKYRPAHFDEVVGQEHVTDTLKNAVLSDHLAHAFLFCGPRGVGKTTCARILAKVLNCTDLQDNVTPCHQCASCKSFDAHSSFNIFELDAASNNSVEHIRNLIEQVRFQPQEGTYKVFIIDEVHMLSQQAFNAFLKTLEEPPAYAIFILATTEKHKILPTILSRCQIFDFRRIQVPETVAHLQNICKTENIEAEVTALNVIAQKADGALRDALSIFDRMVSSANNTLSYQQVIDNLNILDYDYYIKLTYMLASSNIPEALLLYDEVLRKGFDPEIFLAGLGEHFRNILVATFQKTKPLLELSGEIAEKYIKLAQDIPNDFMLTCLKIINECDIHFKTARNQRLHIEMALIQMASIALMAQNTPVGQEKKNLSSEAPSSVAPAIAVQTTKNPAQPIVEKSTKTSHKNNSPANKTTAQTPAIETEQSETSQSETSQPVKRSSTHEEVNEPQSPLSPPDNTPEKTTPAKGMTLRSKLKNKTTGLSLNAIQQQLKDAEQKQKEIAASALPLHLDNVTMLWNDYMEATSSPSLKANMESATLDLEDNIVKITVATSLARQSLLEELELLEFLQKKFFREDLKRQVDVDDSLLPQKPKEPKVFTPKEKYNHLLERNPALALFNEKFKLKIDADA